MQIIKPGTTIDFIGKRKPMAVASVVAVLTAAFLAVFGNIIGFGPKYGVDFAGGTLIHLKVADGIDVGTLREGLRGVGLSDDSVQAFGGSGSEYLVRVESVNFGADEFFEAVSAKLKAEFGEDMWKSFDWERGQSVDMAAIATKEIDVPAVTGVLAGMNPDVTVVESKVDHQAVVINFPGITDQVKKQLAGILGADAGGEARFEVLSVEMVGPSVGAELRRQGLLAIFFSLILILIYVAFRFDLSFAPGAVTALFHDVAITIGIFCILGREFTLPTIGALLTIVGYSLNDTIVVYDRIRENLRRFPKRDLGEVINVSLNETLSRTILTSVTTLLAVAALMILGGAIIADFALALMIGVVIGTYSSVFVASPLILSLQRWLPVEIPPDDDTDDRNQAQPRGRSVGLQPGRIVPG
jgi:preprotein translocase subunit SecF